MSPNTLKQSESKYMSSHKPEPDFTERRTLIRSCSTRRYQRDYSDGRTERCTEPRNAARHMNSKVERHILILNTKRKW